jgi:hypothetical protein
MKTRIHVVLDEAEKERFRRQAEMEGKSLSAWFREAAHDKLAANPPLRLETRDELRAFFDACDARETGKEPDWAEHRGVIEGSIQSGRTDS